MRKFRDCSHLWVSTRGGISKKQDCLQRHDIASNVRVAQDLPKQIMGLAGSADGIDTPRVNPAGGRRGKDSVVNGGSVLGVYARPFHQSYLTPRGAQRLPRGDTKI